MKRRRFLAQSLIAACAARTPLALAQSRSAGCAPPPAGVQLFTVRDLLQQDVRATLAALREIGIEEAELYGLSGSGAEVLGMPAAELQRVLAASGIAVPVAHIDGSLEGTAGIAETAKALGIGTLVVALPSEFSGMRDGRFQMVPAQSKAQLDALAAKLERAGREYGSHGLGFGYHNHHVEFVPVEGVVPFDYLASRTDPELVKLELDLGWIALAGADPVEYLRRHAGRVIACHMKDYDAAIDTDVPQRKLVAPGAGSIDFSAVLAAMLETGVPHAFVEIDVSDDPLGAVRRGHRHLQSLKGCA